MYFTQCVGSSLVFKYKFAEYVIDRDLSTYRSELQESNHSAL